MFQPRRANSRSTPWSSDEEALLLDYLRNNKFNLSSVKQLFPNRSIAAVKSKTRKMRIKYDIFGESYRSYKMEVTDKYGSEVNPKVVFEAFAGAGHQTESWIKYANELFASDKGSGKKDQFKLTIQSFGFEEISSNESWTFFQKGTKKIFFFSGNAIDAALEIRRIGKKIDLVDLDTCGSTLPLLPMLINIINPSYLAITHGEFHSLRFGRDDVLRRVLFHRDINNTCINLSMEQLAQELDKAVKVAALRSDNETKDSCWAELIDEDWLGTRPQGMLRRLYKLTKGPITADCLNSLIES